MVENDVASRAYSYWLQRGRGPGSELDDWLQAESDLRRIRDLTRRLCETRQQLRRLEDLSESQLARLWQTQADLRHSNRVRKAMLEHTFDAAIALDLQGRVVEFNAAAEIMFGCRAEQILDQPICDWLLPSALRERILEFTSECAAAEPPHRPGCRFETTARRPDGTEFPIEVSLVPAPPARPREAIAFLRDLSEVRSARQSLRAQQSVAAALSASSTIAEAGPRLLDAVCDSLDWDAAAFWRVIPHTGRFQCLSLRQAADLGSKIVPTNSPCTIGASQSLFGMPTINRQPVWISNLASSPHFAGKSELVTAGLRTAIAIPIGDAGGEVGLIELFSRRIRHPNLEVLSTLACIGGQIAQFFERRQAETRLSGWEHEAALACAIQQGLLPHDPPDLAGFEFGGGSMPAQQTGGDFLDYFPFPDGTLAVAMGDASGHGIAAALLIAETRAYLRALALTHVDAARILTLMNQRLAEDTGSSSFVTLFLCRLNPTSRQLVYSNAGHWPAYVMNAAGNVRAELASTNIPLGLDSSCTFESAEPVTLNPGDLVFLFTDGVLDAFGPDHSLFGLNRALDYVRTHRHESSDEIVAGLFREVLHHASHRLIDDMSAVIFKASEETERRF